MSTRYLDKYRYHTGNLARDRMTDAVANMAAHRKWVEYLNGRVTLIQQKLDANTFAYFAVPARRPMPLGG